MTASLCTCLPYLVSSIQHHVSTTVRPTFGVRPLFRGQGDRSVCFPATHHTLESFTHTRLHTPSPPPFRFKATDLDVDAEYDFDGGLEMYESKQGRGTRDQQQKRERDKQVSTYARGAKLEDQCMYCPSSECTAFQLYTASRVSVLSFE